MCHVAGQDRFREWSIHLSRSVTVLISSDYASDTEKCTFKISRLRSSRSEVGSTGYYVVICFSYQLKKKKKLHLDLPKSPMMSAPSLCHCSCSSVALSNRSCRIVQVGGVMHRPVARQADRTCTSCAAVSCTRLRHCDNRKKCERLCMVWWTWEQPRGGCHGRFLDDRFEFEMFKHFLHLFLAYW